jgi:hypothetical protein
MRDSANLKLPNAARVAARLVGTPVPHPTAGYRDWKGSIDASEPIIALVLNITGPHVSWARSSHRGDTSLEARILFAPYDSAALDVQVTFGVGDAIAYGRTTVESRLMHPTPELKEFVSGELTDIAVVPGDPSCLLKILVLARSDVKSVRNGVWHAKPDIIESIDEPWRAVLTYGRSGTFDAKSPLI